MIARIALALHYTRIIVYRYAELNEDEEQAHDPHWWVTAHHM